MGLFNGDSRAEDAAPVTEDALAGESETNSLALRPSYLWDGGVVPFFYGSAAVALGMKLYGKPVDSPRLFPESEGGEEFTGDTVPELAVTLYAVGLGGLIAAAPTSARWYHFKGYAETIATTAAVTEIVKELIGRHRPHYQEGMPENLDQRRSFFSGHASITAAGTVYMGLYLSRNIMPRPSLIRTGSLLILGGILVGVPYSRVVDHRHHLSDVLTGAAAGSAIAAAFYAYQQGRYMRDDESQYQSKRRRLQLVPNLRNPGVSLLSRW